MLCSAASTSTNVRWWIASTGTYVRGPVTFFHSNGSRRLEVSRTCLSYEGRLDRLKASDPRLEFETAQRYFDSFLFTLTSPNATCKNCRQSDNVNCQRGCRGTEVITKKLSDHEIFITKIYIHVIFSNFTKLLNHENLELYGIIESPNFILGAWYVYMLGMRQPLRT